MAHDLSKLKRHLDHHNRCVQELNNVNFTKEMLLIIHRPGWTTPAELALVENAVEALARSVESHTQQATQLLEAAKQIKATGAAAEAA